MNKMFIFSVLPCFLSTTGKELFKPVEQSGELQPCLYSGLLEVHYIK